MCTIHSDSADALTLKAAQDLAREIGNFSPKLEKVLTFLLGESRDVRELVKKEGDAARAELEKKATELGDRMDKETDRIKEIFKASSTNARSGESYCKSRAKRPNLL